MSCTVSARFGVQPARHVACYSYESVTAIWDGTGAMEREPGIFGDFKDLKFLISDFKILRF